MEEEILLQEEKFLEETTCESVDSNPNYNISIDTLNYGYIVRVGCKSFSIESPDKLVTLLAMYLNNPQDTINLYNKGELFKN